MHVLILPSWYPRYDGDAEGSFFRDQAQALAASGSNVGVVFSDLLGPGRYFRYGRKKGLSVQQHGPINEVRSHGFNWFPRIPALYANLWLRHADRAIGLYIEKFGKPDILHVHSMDPAGMFAVRISERYNVPFVITEHSSLFFREDISKFHRDNIGEVSRKSAINIAVSEVFADRLCRLTGRDWRYLPNIVSDRFLAAPIVAHDEKPFRLVSAAMLSANKRLDLVIEAVAELRHRGRNVTLTIIGEGGERARLEQMVVGFGLTRAINFAGHVAVPDMPAAMAASDLLVSSSNFETFGVTLVEAMALGMPIIATRSGGPESIVTPDVGNLVGIGDATGLADAVVEIMDNIDRYRPEDIRARCTERFSGPVIARQLQTIYAEAIADAGR